jgi:hypothetical protein
MMEKKIIILNFKKRIDFLEKKKLLALSMWKLTLGYCNRRSGYLQNEWFPTLCFAYHIILRGECQVNGGLGNKHHVQL